MASDIKAIWNTDYAEADISQSGGDLVREDGLETAVLMSIYTDRQANVDDEIPDGTDNRRGWWADIVNNTNDDKIGSRLWLLDRSKTDDQTIADAQFYIEECLQWMIDDGVCQDINVIVERYDIEGSSSRLGFQVSILQSDGTTKALKFNDLWTAQMEAA